MKIDSKTIAVAAITVALTFVFGYLPFVFLVPMLFTACTRGLKMTLFIGAVFGFVSLMYALSGATPIAIAFIEAPYIPIIPRIATAFVAYSAFTLSKKLIKGNTKAKITLPYIIAAAAGTLSNTAFVVSLLVIVFGNTELAGVTMIMFVPTMLLYGCIELAVNIAIVPVISISVQRALLGRRFFEQTLSNSANSEATNATANTQNNTTNTTLIKEEQTINESGI